MLTVYIPYPGGVFKDKGDFDEVMGRVCQWRTAREFRRAMEARHED